MTLTWVVNYVLNACYNSIARDNSFVRRRLSCEINVCQGRSFDKEFYMEMPFSPMALYFVFLLKRSFSFFDFKLFCVL